MTARTWIGGGNNHPGNANDWSVAGAPQPGDTLTDTGAAPMDIAGGGLAGDQVVIPMDATWETGQPVVFNMTNGGSLNVQAFYDTVDINASGTVNLETALLGGQTNISGGTIRFIHAALNGDVNINSNIAAGSTLGIGGGEGNGADVTINGRVGSGAVINVAANQPCLEINITHPSQFFGTINFGDQGPPGPGFGVLTLDGLHATGAVQVAQTVYLFDGSRIVGSTQVSGYTNSLLLQQTSAGVAFIQGDYSPGLGLIPLGHAG